MLSGEQLLKIKHTSKIRINLYRQKSGIAMLEGFSILTFPFSSSSEAEEATAGVGKKTEFSKKSCGFTESHTMEATANVIFGIGMICYRRVMNVSLRAAVIEHFSFPSFQFQSQRRRSKSRSPGCHGLGCHKTPRYSLFI